MIAILESPQINTLGDLLDRLGGISADRVRLRPAPGDATEKDCFDAERRFGVLCELIDGTLVEKPMGLYESVLAGIISRLLGEFVAPRRLGIVALPDGMFRVMPGQIRMPDVSFTSWSRLPADYTKHAAADLAPDLAIEVLSPGNTAGEVARKRKEFFAGGTRLMWIVDPATRTVTVFKDASSEPTVFTIDQILDGADVLAGFSLSIRGIFEEADRPRA